MSYQATLKYVAPALAVALILLVAAWALGLRPAAATAERGSEPTVIPSQGGDQVVALPYDAIQVSGHGTATGAPDLANLSLSVTVVEDTVAGASATAATTTQSVREALMESGVAADDIATSYFRISEEKNYGPEGPEFVGYNVSNGLSVTVRDVDNVGSVIDAAIGAGGDHFMFNHLSFQISDTTELEREARENAVMDMMTRAEQIAEFSGRSLGDLKMVNEGGGADLFGSVVERAFAPVAAAASFDTPITAGENTVSVSVFGVYELRR